MTSSFPCFSTAKSIEQPFSITAFVLLSYTMANCTFPSLEYKTDVKSLSFIAKSLCKLGIYDFDVCIIDVPFVNVVSERVTVFKVHRIATEVMRGVLSFRET